MWRSLILITILLIPLAATAQPTTPAPEAASAVSKVDLDLVVGYAKRLGITGQRDSEGFAGRVIFDGKPYDLLISVDPARFVCYLAVLNLKQVKASDPKRDAVLARAMELNFRLAIGKLEWDRDQGQIRLSHTFSTERGLEYETFRGVLLTLLSAAEPIRTELDKSE